MNILYVVPYTPNQIRVRPYNLIRQLTNNGHRVTVLCLNNTSDEMDDAAALADLCHRVIVIPLTRRRSIWNCLTSFPTDKPLQSVYCWQPDLDSRLIKLICDNSVQNKIDIVHVEHLRGVRYGLSVNQVINRNGLKLPVVWDSVDCISLLFRQSAKHSTNNVSRWITRFELGRTEKYEAWLLDQFSNILVTSPVDKQAMEELVSPEKKAPDIRVLSNGVDLENFRPDPSIQRELGTIVVSGKMSYHANISMVLHLTQKIMPLVWAKRPDTKLIISGKDPSPAIRQLARYPDIEVTGTVPDIRLYLQRATIAVAPIVYGAGIQNKILEAMACGTPVIAASQAINALNVEIDRDILVADSSEEFAGKIISLLSDQARQQTLSRNGRHYVETFHNWDTTANKLEDIYISAKNKTV